MRTDSDMRRDVRALASARPAPKPSRWLLVLLLCVANGIGGFLAGAYVMRTARPAPVPSLVQQAATPPPQGGSPTAQVARQVRASGYVISDQRALVSAVVNARIVEVLVREGDMVTAGQVLARLDGSAARAEVAIMDARHAAVRSRAGELEQELKLATSDLTQAQALFDAGFNSDVVLQRAQSRVAILADRRKGLAADITAAGAEVAKAKVFQGKHVVRAPFAGVVVERIANPGETTWESATNVGRSGIVSIHSLDRLMIEVDVPDSLFHGLNLDAPVLVKFDGLQQHSLQAKISEVLPTVDRNKGTRKVRIDIGRQPAAVRPGMLAQVTLEGLRDER